MQIICKDLSYTYNIKAKFAKKALENISLVINEGEFLGIIGHTGSGKSTFIQHINGLIRVQQGELHIGNINLSPKSKPSKKELKELRSKVGLVFQYPEYQLFAETVFEDVAFGLKNFNKNLKNEEIEREVSSALEKVGLDYNQIKNKSPFELSGGQKRRVAIAGVLVTKPEILILDEPVAGLDPMGKKKLMQLLHKIHDEYVKTIIIVSHDMDEVSENCTNIVVFSEGKIIKEGTPKYIFMDSKTLFDLRLDIPITAKIYENLKKEGININTNYKIEDFIESIRETYKELKNAK